MRFLSRLVSEFEDIFDVDHFILSLRDQVRILRKLPPRLERRFESRMVYSLSPISWSNMSYYFNQVGLTREILGAFSVRRLSFNFFYLTDRSFDLMRLQILPLVQKYKVVHLNKTDARLANNGLAIEVQKLRCRVNFNALRFTSPIEELGRKVVQMLRDKGPFLVLHLRYEMDMLAFSGCTRGCNNDEVDELTRMRYCLFCSFRWTFVSCTLDYLLLTSASSLFRYAYPWWKEKVIDSELKRKEGLCPLTPEETSLVLSALGINRNVQIYIASGEIYGGERRMENLASAFPNLVSWWNWKFELFKFCLNWIGPWKFMLSSAKTGQKRDAAETVRLVVLSESFITDGRIGLSRLVGERHLRSYLWWEHGESCWRASSVSNNCNLVNLFTSISCLF